MFLFLICCWMMGVWCEYDYSLIFNFTLQSPPIKLSTTSSTDAMVVGCEDSNVYVYTRGSTTFYLLNSYSDAEAVTDVCMGDDGLNFVVSRVNKFMVYEWDGSTYG